MATGHSALNAAVRRGTAATLGGLGAEAIRSVISPHGAIGSVEPADAAEPRRAQALAAIPPSLLHPQLPEQAKPEPAKRSVFAAAISRSDSPPAGAPSGVPSRTSPQAIQTSPFAAIAVDPAARRNLHTAKVLARLVSAILLRPATEPLSAQAKAEQLAHLLASATAAADRLLTSLAPLDTHRGWLRANAMEAAVQMLVSQWESDADQENASIDSQLDVLEAVFSQARLDEHLDEALQALDEARYEQAEATDVAVDRIKLSASLAAWDLYGSVTHARLGKGSYRFTYGVKPEQIVARLLPHALAMAREFGMSCANLDVSTSHHQACIRRAAQLIGAEYVARTRLLMNWIAADEVDDLEYRRRHDQGCAALETQIVPAVVECAHENFKAIQEIVQRRAPPSEDPLDAPHKNTPETTPGYPRFS